VIKIGKENPEKLNEMLLLFPAKRKPEKKIK